MAHKFDSILAFILVVEENGFAAAARKKGVSTAAISRQVSSLETALGGQLLHRTTRQIRLTDIGEQYYQQCKNTLRDLADAELSITHSKSEASGILNVLSNRYFAITFILPKLSEFIALQPKLCVNLQLAERFPEFDKEDIDILFGVSLEGSADLVRKRIASTRYVLCASPDYLSKHGAPAHPTDMVKHQYITHSIRLPNDRILFKGGIDVRVNPILYLNDSYAMRECALRGMGIVNLHDYMVQEAITDGRLIEILEPYQESALHVYLYYQKARFLQPKIRQFIDFYTENLIES